MGMDVYGRKPSAEAGKYFRANVWSWAPIHNLIVELCSDLFKERTLRRMAMNDGAGARNQAVCTEMANRFEAWMEHHAEGHGIDSEELRVLPGGRLVLGDSPEAQNMETESPYKVSDEHLKEWIEFLRHCGGFKVW
jgi:hypothetical protein